MALTKPPVGTRVRHLTFNGDDHGRMDYLAVEEIYGTVVPDPEGYSDRIKRMYLDVLFDDGTAVLYMDDSEFEVAK